MENIEVSDREFDHILAALRVYQRLLDNEAQSYMCRDVEEIATYRGEQMTPEEIDELCQRINTANVNSRQEEAIRAPQCTVENRNDEPRIICPHCHKATTPRIVEDAAIYWERARVVEGEKVIACCDEIYRGETVNIRLQCVECWQEFAPPEGYTVEWR